MLLWMWMDDLGYDLKAPAVSRQFSQGLSFSVGRLVRAPVRGRVGESWMGKHYLLRLCRTGFFFVHSFHT